ncbi:MAG: hypothetical protein IPI30_22830 [Saprospiraceae bacterium]|nr:hypothetical protein [Candidatus Vicinibacter affinis]
MKARSGKWPKRMIIWSVVNMKNTRDQLSGNHPDFICFYHEITGNFILHGWILLGMFCLRSEGYPTIVARDQGIKAVIESRSHRERFKLEQGHGAYFLCLTASNHREIGRSCPKKTIEETWALISQEKYQTKSSCGGTS